METMLFISLIGVIVVTIVEGNRGERERYKPVNRPQLRTYTQQPHRSQFPEPVYDHYDDTGHYRMDEIYENHNPDDDIPYNPNMH